MSALHPPPTTPGSLLCPRCGSVMREDQAWCLECGLAARTRVHPPPGWRGPIVATLIALALLAAGIAFALVALLDEPEATPAPTTVTLPAATTPPATTPPAATTPTTPAPTTPGATTPTTPAATTPTVPGATPPAATTPTTPSATTPAPSGGRPRTFTIPGTGIELPATGDSDGR